jgi:hypothetical protein
MTDIVELTESKASFSRRLGVSDRRVSALVADGLPLAPDGKVRINAALEWVAARQNPVRSVAGRMTGAMRRDAAPEAPEDDDDAPPTSGAPKEVIDYWAEKARKERAAASLAELKLAVQKGELLPADEVRATVYALAKAEREAWPSRVAPVLAASLGVDLGSIQRALVAEVNQHLAELAEVAI